MARIPNIGGAFSDLVTFFRGRRRHELLFAVLAILVTFAVVFAFDRDSYFERAPDITYIDLLPPNRSDAEIARGNLERSVARHAAEAERRRQFRELADQLGIEVDNAAAPATSPAKSPASTGAENRKP